MDTHMSCIYVYVNQEIYVLYIYKTGSVIKENSIESETNSDKSRGGGELETSPHLCERSQPVVQLRSEAHH